MRFKETLNSNVLKGFQKFGSPINLLTICVLVYSISISIKGSLIGGESIDVKGHLDQLMGMFDNYRHPFTHRSLSALEYAGTSVIDDKGNASFFISHLVNSILGNDRFFQFASSSHDAAVVRNLVNSVIGHLGVYATYQISRSISSSERTAKLSAIALMAIPTWTGSYFINPRDTTFAVGYTCITAACCFLVQPEKFDLIKNFKKISLLISVGLFLSIGTRISGWPIVAGTTGVALTIRYFLIGNATSFKKTIISLSSPYRYGSVLVILVNPQILFLGPKYLIKVASSASSFNAWGGYIRFFGKTYFGGFEPWFYVPGWVFAQTPLGIGLAALIGIPLLVHKAVRADTEKTWAVIPPLFQLLGVPVFILINGSLLYNGSRQVMFMFPIIALLSGQTFGKLIDFCSQKRTWIIVGFVLTIFIPISETFRLFPYLYIYINPIAANIGAPNGWEFDYFGLSRFETQHLTHEYGEINTYPLDYSVSASSTQNYFRWFDPNIIGPPSGCKKSIISRPMGFNRVNIAYIASCNPDDFTSLVSTAVVGCSKYSLSCLKQNETFSSANMDIQMSPMRRVSGPYSPQLCLDTAITATTHTVIYLREFTFELVDTQNDRRAPTFDTSNYLRAFQKKNELMSKGMGSGRTMCFAIHQRDLHKYIDQPIAVNVNYYSSQIATWVFNLQNG